MKTFRSLRAAKYTAQSIADERKRQVEIFKHREKRLWTVDSATNPTISPAEWYRVHYLYLPSA